MMSSFETVLKPLLRHLGITSDDLLPDDSYVLNIGEALEVYLVEACEDRLLMVSSLGVLDQNFERDALWRLLAANLFGELPFIHIGAVSEEKKIILWTQERLDHLNSDNLINLFERFMLGIDNTKHILNGVNMTSDREYSASSAGRNFSGRFSI